MLIAAGYQGQMRMDAARRVYFPGIDAPGRIKSFRSGMSMKFKEAVWLN
jgi:hypothetical protein